MQADCRRRLRVHPPLRSKPIRRAAAVGALLACAPAHMSSLQLMPVANRLVNRSSTRYQRWSNPHCSSFALAADLLEISACLHCNMSSLFSLLVTVHLRLNI
eukprot:5771436-Pleurochrysis_carterae.AAC.1